MKRTIKAALIGIVMLVFLAACNPDIGDGQSGEAGDGSSLPSAANWLKGTWSGNMTVKVEGHSMSDHIAISDSTMMVCSL